MTLTDISNFYANYPLESSFLTCGVKASLADGFAQFKEMTPNKNFVHEVEVRRNFAYLVYGGIFIGIMARLEYDCLFPLLFSGQEGWLKIVSEIFFDNFIIGPWVWLPPAYLIQAIVYDYPLKEGLSKYVQDVRQNQLLLNYWKIWVPAQTISFSVIPDHLRVVFMASVSFFWFLLFSTLASKDASKT